MKNKNFLSCVCAVSLVALSLVGCSDYDNGYTEQQLQFIKNFKDIYGDVDPTQDWNFAERANVTVTVSSPSNIKIYAKTNGKYKIVGDYEDVLGTEILGFDVVEGTTDIMVTDCRTAQYTTVGNSVIFDKTRGILTDNDDDDVDIAKEADYYEIGKDTYSAWRKYIPEKKFNLGKVSENFVYVSTGEFTIYPIYWHTSNENTLGIYYLEDNDVTKIHYVDIYEIKKNKPDGAEFGEIRVCQNYTEVKEGEEDNNIWVDADDGEVPYTITFDANDNLTSGPDRIKAQGIKVNIKAGTVFGMFIREKGGHIAHSNNIRNLEVGVDYNLKENGDVDLTSIVNNSNLRASYAATFIDNGKMYIGFEDWEYGGSYKTTGTYKEDYPIDCDFDLNDCLFMFGENIPEIVDDGADRWMISAEDLGNTYDIDYNDVVIEVEHVAGRRTAYVIPYAAGGTLASYVYFNGEPVGKGVIGSNGKEKTGEIHELFSGDHAVDTSGDYIPINVDGTKMYEYSKRTYPVTVPRDFSLASNVPDRDPATTTESQDMEGFEIWVLQQGVQIPNGGLTEKMIQTLQQDGKIQKIKNFPLVNGEKRTDNVPYVICTPKYWTRTTDDGLPVKGHYRWPQERVPMLPTDGFSGAAYNDTEHSTFAQWVANKEQAQDWYKYPDETVTCAPTKIGLDPEAGIFNPNGSGNIEDSEGVVAIQEVLNDNDKNEWVKWGVSYKLYSLTIPNETYGEGTTITITQINDGVDSQSNIDFYSDENVAKDGGEGGTKIADTIEYEKGLLYRSRSTELKGFFQTIYILCWKGVDIGPYVTLTKPENK